MGKAAGWCGSTGSNGSNGSNGSRGGYGWRRWGRAGLGVALAAGVVVAGAARAAAPAYRYQELPGLGGTISEARAIGPTGLIAGFSQVTPGGDNHAVLWRDGVPLDLHPSGSAPISLAFDVNALGQVVGQVVATEPFGSVAVRWDPVGSAAPPLLVPLSGRGGGYAIAYGINARGTAAGLTTPVDLLMPEATVWRDELALGLPTLGGVSAEARALNAAGVVVGASAPVDRFPRAATLWREGVPVALPELGAPDSTALAINEHGDAVGFARVPDGALHAALWPAGGGVLDLGARIAPDTFSSAFGLNDRGQVVGQFGFTSAELRAALWQDGRAVDLNTLIDPALGARGLVLAAAFDIDERGAIVGAAFDTVTGVGQAYLLTPVPEPEALLLMAPGLLLLALRARAGRRRRR